MVGLKDLLKKGTLLGMGLLTPSLTQPTGASIGAWGLTPNSKLLGFSCQREGFKGSGLRD